MTNFNAHRLIKNSIASTKTCYWVGCNNKPIKAHAISKSRLLSKIAEKGMVMFMNPESKNGFELVSTGQAKATTFPGFCDLHDKIFLPVDNQDYEYSDIQNFLFANRAAAMEYIHKRATTVAVEELLKGPLDPIVKIGLEMNLELANLTVQEAEQARRIFKDLYEKQNYHAIGTKLIVIDGVLPVVCSAAFYFELDERGNTINDTIGEESKNKLDISYMTLFPQNGKTYCIISYMNKARKKFSFLDKFVNATNHEKQILVSNLLVSYTESFAVSPMYWEEMGEAKRTKLVELFTETLAPGYLRALIVDSEFNLFG
jgi:hypothetical protein